VKTWLAQRWNAAPIVPGPAGGLPWMIGEGFEISEACRSHGRPSGGKPEVFTKASKPSFCFLPRVVWKAKPFSHPWRAQILSPNCRVLTYVSGFSLVMRRSRLLGKASPDS